MPIKFDSTAKTWREARGAIVLAAFFFALVAIAVLRLGGAQ